MTSPIDLTTLADVQAWLTGPGDQPPADLNGVLSRLITTCSSTIMAYLQRVSFVSQEFVDVVDGKGNRAAFLQNWPVTSIVGVTIDGKTVGPSTGLTFGYLLQPWDGYPPGNIQALNFVGGACLPRGRNNISISYIAGYLVQGEAWVVPGTPFELTVNQPNGAWTKDAGVTYANGTALTLVSGTPSVGQYALVPGTPGGYQFAAADAAAAVLISYSYVPWSIREAATDMVGERYRYRTRIGEKSRAQGGQVTASYDLSEIPAYVESMLRPYRKVLPV